MSQMSDNNDRRARAFKRCRKPERTAAQHGGTKARETRRVACGQPRKLAAPFAPVRARRLRIGPELETSPFPNLIHSIAASHSGGAPTPSSEYRTAIPVRVLFALDEASEIFTRRFKPHGNVVRPFVVVNPSNLVGDVSSGRAGGSHKGRHDRWSHIPHQIWIFRKCNCYSSLLRTF